MGRCVLTDIVGHVKHAARDHRCTVLVDREFVLGFDQLAFCIGQRVRFEAQGNRIKPRDFSMT